MARTMDVTVTLPPHLCEMADGVGVDPRLLVLALVYYPHCTSSVEEFRERVIEIGELLAEGRFQQMEERMRDDPDWWLRHWQSGTSAPGPSVWEHILEDEG